MDRNDIFVKTRLSVWAKKVIQPAVSCPVISVCFQLPNEKFMVQEKKMCVTANVIYCGICTS